MKIRALLVAALVILCPLPASAVSQDSGSLTINDQAIYDNGKTIKGGERDYDVKTVFGPRMEKRNRQLQTKAQRPVAKAKKLVFTKKVRSQAKIDRHNQRVIKKYLFTKHYHATHAVGNVQTERPWFSRYAKGLSIAVVVCVMIILGSWLGLRFSKYRARALREGKNERGTNSHRSELSGPNL